LFQKRWSKKESDEKLSQIKKEKDSMTNPFWMGEETEKSGMQAEMDDRRKIFPIKGNGVMPDDRGEGLTGEFQCFPFLGEFRVFCPAGDYHMSPFT
jgi:hypothetical protein